MAIILSDKYPGRSNPPSLDYPQGSIKDQSAPGAKDGTPLKADWANDHEGFFQSLLKEADITANGQVDTAASSQYFEALKAVIESESPNPSQATESTAGIAKIATQTNAKLLSESGTIIDPAKLGAVLGSWVIRDVFASRAIGVTYTNTTKALMIVNIQGNTTIAAGSASVTVNGFQVIGSAYSEAGRSVAVTAAVPPGATYIVPTGQMTIGRWTEVSL